MVEAQQAIHLRGMNFQLLDQGVFGGMSLTHRVAQLNFCGYEYPGCNRKLGMILRHWQFFASLLIDFQGALQCVLGVKQCLLTGVAAGEVVASGMSGKVTRMVPLSSFSSFAKYIGDLLEAQVLLSLFDQAGANFFFCVHRKD